MKCDRFLSSLVTGGPVARWRARRHVARCHRCAEVQIQLRNITRELADTPQLTAAQRALWTAAGTEPAITTGRPAWIYGAALVAATVAVGAIGLMLRLPHAGGQRDRPDFVNSAPPRSAPGSPQPSERGKLADEMLAKVELLERELTELRRAGELLDARKDADALWKRYNPRTPSSF
jgi:hypothetical protein